MLEIGFGNGAALRFAAQQDPSRDYIGVEVHAPGVGRLLNALAEDGSDHVRLYHHDAVEVLEKAPTAPWTRSGSTSLTRGTRSATTSAG